MKVPKLIPNNVKNVDETHGKEQKKKKDSLSRSSSKYNKCSKAIFQKKHTIKLCLDCYYNNKQTKQFISVTLLSPSSVFSSPLLYFDLIYVMKNG